MKEDDELKEMATIPNMKGARVTYEYDECYNIINNYSNDQESYNVYYAHKGNFKHYFNQEKRKNDTNEATKIKRSNSSPPL